MTTKKAIILGVLTSIAIGLTAICIKTNGFKNKITSPLAEKRNEPVRVNAEDIQPISTKWFFNDVINYTFPSGSTKTTIYNGTFNIGTINQATALKINTYGIYYTINGNDVLVYAIEEAEIRNNGWYEYTESRTTYHNQQYRVVNFSTNPTGTLNQFLQQTATPVYNGDILMIAETRNDYKNRAIIEVRKNNIPQNIENIDKGEIINQTGIIDIYLDSGLNNININGTTHYLANNEKTITITNNNVLFYAQGTNTGQTGYIVHINYVNTRPEITPTPYPDPGEQTIEVIPIIPMMFQILTMPFSFISQAFNLTLWEGTPYAFNFSNFIMSLIAIATILFIIKLFTSGFSVIGNYTYSRADKDFKKSQTRLNNAKSKNIENNTPRKTESKVTIKKEK